MAVLPMFPLESVLLPGAVLPLHVFEPRYRALVIDCMAAEEHEFGVTMIARGREVGGGDQRMSIGTVARMVQVGEMTDGRFALVCVGTRRVRVNAWLPDDPYPLADVDDLLDDETDATDLGDVIAGVTSRVRRAAAMAAELGDSAMDASSDISDDPLLASYHLAALAPIGPADTYDLLCASGPVRRLALLTGMLDDIEAVLQFRLLHDSSVLVVDDPDVP